MMDVASYDRCRDLYQLSGWERTDQWHHFKESDGEPYVGTYDKHEAYCPAYALGLLRREIINGIEEQADVSNKRMLELYDQLKQALLRGEDTTAEFAIKLFRQGVLKKEDDCEQT